MSDKAEPCCAKVPKGSNGWRMQYAQCTRSGKVQRDGKWYCGQHDPEAKAERRRKANHDRADRRTAEEREWRIANSAPALLSLLIESRTSIGGDWGERRDAAIIKATGDTIHE